MSTTQPRPPASPASQDLATPLRALLEAAAADAAKALAAAKAGRPDQALWATADLQRRIAYGRGLLEQAAQVRRSKRVPLEQRRAVTETTAAGIEPLAEAVRGLALELKARRLRRDALAEALRARVSRPGSVYTARGAVGGRGGAVRPDETVKRLVTVTV